MYIYFFFNQILALSQEIVHRKSGTIFTEENDESNGDFRSEA